MRVLLTGSSSLLGTGVVRALHARGDEVAVLQRRPSAVAAELGLTEHLADLTDAPTVARATRGWRRSSTWRPAWGSSAAPRSSTRPT